MILGIASARKFMNLGTLDLQNICLNMGNAERLGTVCFFHSLVK